MSYIDVPPIQIFIGKSHQITSTESNRHHFLRIPVVRWKILSEGDFLRICFMDAPTWVLPENYKSVQVKRQTLSIVLLLIIFTYFSNTLSRSDSGAFYWMNFSGKNAIA